MRENANSPFRNVQSSVRRQNVLKRNITHRPQPQRFFMPPYSRIVRKRVALNLNNIYKFQEKLIIFMKVRVHKDRQIAAIIDF